MIRLAVEDLVAGRLDGFYRPGHPVYVVRDADVALSVGVSVDPINRLLQHTGRIDIPNANQTSLGRLLLETAAWPNPPWIELWCQGDWETIYRKQIPIARDTADDRLAERALIIALRPCLNAVDNNRASPLPSKYLHARPTDSSARYLPV